ncbi:prepilin peptidase [Paenibacillus nasutitermitis]|uniref:Prepilin leader peptidase/N-methyltransferase n=1 Tax=Paenibacillus nasutitermitis TaxID=1652958 RepID=A0A916YJF1_9BACL|nr:A24 family peptidase [Paenibacillus nasutitermitis]GGD48019.1 type 4 prepilin-like proteins leader peptide-processing enzyme [Paenibacillus nasutitermitis]
MTIAITIYVFVLGLACGSFFNVVGLRVPAGKSIMHPPSSCTACGSRLGARDLVPVLSYLLSQGRCRRCGAEVSALYPLGELAAGLLFVWLYLRFGFGEEAPLGLLLVSLAVIISVSDLKYMLIPNKVLLAFLPFFVIVRLLAPGGQPLWQYLLGAVAGGGVIVLIILLSRGGMGMGDAKLFALCGLVVGFPHILLALMLACLLGTLVGGSLLFLGLVKRKQPIPFGPFLAAGTIIAYGYGTALINGYLSIIA